MSRNLKTNSIKRVLARKASHPRDRAVEWLKLPVFLYAAALAAWLAPGAAGAQTATYFMPPKPPVTETATPIFLAQVAPGPATYERQSSSSEAFATPVESGWRRPPTDWEVLGLGVAATGASLLFDHGVNQYATSHLSPAFRNNIASRATHILTLAPLAFAAATMFQSPVSDPMLAHASSIAVTAAALTTLESAALKYAVGRERGVSGDSDPFVAHPFSSASSSFSIGLAIPSEGGTTSSFPSGHTALAFALVTPYAELYHQPWLYALPVTVGLGQVAAGDGRWLSDVVGGGFLGWLTADLTRRYFPDSDFGLILFDDGRQMKIGFVKAF